MNERPPEQQRGDKEREMLKCVDCFAVQRCVEESGNMPGPQGDRMDQPGHEWNREYVPETVDPGDLRDVAEMSRPVQWQRPEKCDQWPAEHEQRCSDEHQDLVLRHVRGEQDASPCVHRRDECDEQCEPAARETECFPRANRATLQTIQADDE